MLESFDYSCKSNKFTLDKISPKSKKIVLRSSSKHSQPFVRSKKNFLKIQVDSNSSKTQEKFFKPKYSSAQSTPKAISSMLNTSNLKYKKSSYKLLPSRSFKALNFSMSPKNNHKVEKYEFPMKPKKVLTNLKHQLTNFEQGEILKYNEIHYIGSINNKLMPNPDKENQGLDDSHSDYILVKNDHIAYRYEILKLLGKGSFGQVCECFDHKKKEKVALKVIKNKSKFHKQAAIEIRILQLLRESDPQGKANIIQMKNYFLFRNHICIAFELVSISLYEFLKINSFRGLSEGLIKAFTTQILKALEFIENLGIVHCDLKPENILFVNAKKAEIKMIDFGSSCLVDEKIHSYIQSRFYRAPEVILGVPYGCSIDIWSLGCILVELFTGKPLFPGETEKDQLLYILSYLGMPPDEILDVALRKNLFFQGKELKSQELKSGKTIEIGKLCLEKTMKGASEEFIHFVKLCFEWNPEKRMKPAEGLMHPWIMGNKNMSSEKKPGKKY